MLQGFYNDTKLFSSANEGFLVNPLSKQKNEKKGPNSSLLI